MTTTTWTKIETLKESALQWRREATLPQTLALVATGALLLALSSAIRIPLPWTPIPITLQTFAVLLLGMTLGAHASAASVLMYLMTFGGANLPGPTGGYMVGFVAAAWFVGYMTDRYTWTRTFPGLAAIMVVADFGMIHGFGLVWLGLLTGIHHPGTLFTMGTLPFVAGDLLKIIPAVGLGRLIAPQIRS